MSKLSPIASRALDEDTKTLVKAGILDQCLKVDDEQTVLAFVVDKFKGELAAHAREQMAEEDKDAKAK